MTNKKLRFITFFLLFSTFYTFTYALSQPEIDEITDNLILAYYQDGNCTTDNSSRALSGVLTSTVSSQSSPSILENSCDYNEPGKVVFANEHFDYIPNVTVIAWTDHSKGGDQFDVLISQNNDNGIGDTQFIEFDERGGANDKAKIYDRGDGCEGQALITSITAVQYTPTHFNMWTSRRNVTASSFDISLMINTSTSWFAKTTLNCAWSPGGADLWIGNLQVAGGQQFDAGIDELIIVNRTLSDAQVQYVYDENVAGRHILNFTEEEEPSTTCDCPSNGEWRIADGSTCIMTSSDTCHLGSNSLYVENGQLQLQSGAKLYCSTFSHKAGFGKILQQNGAILAHNEV